MFQKVSFVLNQEYLLKFFMILFIRFSPGTLARTHCALMQQFKRPTPQNQHQHPSFHHGYYNVVGQ